MTRKNLSIRTIFMLAFSHSLFAGAIENRTNWSSEYIGNPNRIAAFQSVDAVAYNPGGSAFLDNGFHLGLDNQIIGKNYSHEFVLLGNEREYSADDIGVFLPGFFSSFRKNQWGVTASLTIPGGGGSLTYENGSHTVEPIEFLVQQIPSYQSYNASIKVYSAYISPSFGFTYSFLEERLGVGAGARLISASRTIEVEGNQPLPSPSGKTLIDHKETSQGLSGYLGLSYKPAAQFALSMKYDLPVPLTWKTDKSTIDVDTNSFAQTAPLVRQLRAGLLPAKGEEYDRWLPGMLGLGTAFSPIEPLWLTLSLNWYQQTMADWDGEEDKVDDGWEYGLGAEFQATSKILARAGFIHSLQGANDSTYLTESPALDSYTIGCGVEYNPTTVFGLNLSFAYSQSIEGEKQGYIQPQLNPTSSPETITLNKSLWVAAFGIRFHFE